MPGTQLSPLLVSDPGQGANPLAPPSLYSHFVLHFVADITGGVESRLPPQQVMRYLRSEAHVCGARQLLTCGTEGER